MNLCNNLSFQTPIYIQNYQECYPVAQYQQYVPVYPQAYQPYPQAYPQPYYIPVYYAQPPQQLQSPMSNISEPPQVQSNIPSTIHQHTETKQENDVQESESASEFIPSFETRIQPNNQNNQKNMKQSTNIQKNYAKAVVVYGQKNQPLIKQLLGQKASEFLKLLYSLKNKLRNLSHFSRYTDNEEFLKAFRIISYQFIRKESIAYIFNSKIHQKTSHLKNKRIVQRTLYKF